MTGNSDAPTPERPNQIPTYKEVRQVAEIDSTGYCYYCATTQPIANFTKSQLTKRRSGLNGRCRSCTSAANRQYRLRHPEKLKVYEATRRSPERWSKYRIRSRAKKYGITEAEYRSLFDAQAGKCAICAFQLSPQMRGFGKGTHMGIACIDHCHDSKSVRGLLCQQCNIGIGAFKDRSELLMAAIAYLGRSVKP